MKCLPDLLRRGKNEGVRAGGGKKTRLRCEREEGHGRRWHVVGRPWVGEDLELLGAFGALAERLEGEFLSDS